MHNSVVILSTMNPCEQLSKRTMPSTEDSIQPRKKQKITQIMSVLPDRLTPLRNGSIAPHEFLLTRLSSKGVQVEFVSYINLKDFFFEPTEDEINSYRSDVLNAIRNRDIQALRSFHEQGRPLKCSNQFGESLLHLACRRGFLDVVKFLVEEAHVPLRVRDDYGRTPLHDALWTTEPNFELVDYIITMCPDLLYIKDRRENTPFAFVRKPYWDVWVIFLKDVAFEKLVPKLLSVSKQ